ncbi:MAG TPA: glycine oxidase ThiO [Verrucomicrobiae bacterium]|nr:glycine oxidase ThiO [Verrucomicrobiae bacterium]
MKTWDVAIAGGGIIGASIAFELAAEKLQVVLFDRQSPGREASWAAAGMLSPAPDGFPAIPLIPLAKESLRIYPEFLGEVERTSGMNTDFEREGALHLFRGANAESERDDTVAQYRGLGLSIEPLSAPDARKLENSISEEIGAAAWNPDEARIDPRALTQAVIAGAEKRGVRILPDTPVSGLAIEAGHCRGVVAGGEKISAGQVVLAAGSFSGEILGTRGEIAPTRPVRGQMMSLCKENFRLRHVVRTDRGYLVPRKDGRIIAGSTLEDAGFEKSVTPEGMRTILSAATEMIPELENAEIVERWSGLRPGTPDELPILGPADVKGLFVATGHYRNGILLAPITAKLLREWIVTGKTEFDAEIFSPKRFAR